MGALIQRLRSHLPHHSLLSFLGKSATDPDPPGVPDEIAFCFKECEDGCGPGADEIEAKERERAEHFKRNRLLPIMGWSTGAPG